VDEIVKPAQWNESIAKRANELAQQSDRTAEAKGISLTPLQRSTRDTGNEYEYVSVSFDREAHTATFNVKAPQNVTDHTDQEITGE